MPRSARYARSGRDHLYSCTTSIFSNDVGIELGEILGGDPILQNGLPASLLNVVPVEKVLGDLEPSHVPHPARLDVPVASNPGGVFLVEYRIEDRLVSKPGRPFMPAGRLDECQLLRPGWSPQGHGLHVAKHRSKARAQHPDLPRISMRTYRCEGDARPPGYGSLMWLDSEGVAHTVALPNPSAAMSLEMVASLDALFVDERARVLDELNDYYWNDHIAGSRSDIVSAVLAPEGAPLPDGFPTGTIENAAEAVAMVKATEPAWRIDVLEVVQDYLDPDDCSG
jgi:hypothetical protein